MAINFVQIGKHIGEIRKRRGLSQQKLSEIIDKSPTYLSYIEGGLKCIAAARMFRAVRWQTRPVKRKRSRSGKSCPDILSVAGMI